MSSQKESTVRTLTVALLVCLVCSIFVAGAAVALRPTQQENRLLDKQRSILAIAGLGEAGMSANKVKQLFNERIVARLVDVANRGVRQSVGSIAGKFHGLTLAVVNHRVIRGGSELHDVRAEPVFISAAKACFDRLTRR